jgi:hypothetical protein
MSLSEDNFFKTEQEINAAVIALYNPFSTDWGTIDPGVNIWYASLYNTNVKTYLTRSEITTDELTNAWDMNLKNFTWGASTWQGGDEPTYAKIRFVARATDVIKNIEKSEVSLTIKNKYIAEAKILRAWTMYVLYDFFGPVNVKLDPATLNDTKIIPRPSAEVYCDSIEKDLNDALVISELPEKYNSDGSNWGRVSKGVARMLLLKLYMHNKEWSKAESIANDILPMGYKLEKIYTDVFTKSRNNELIYAVPCNDAIPNYYMQHLFPGDFKEGYAGDILIKRGGGWYGFAMPWSFYDKFPSADLRKSALITQYTANWGGTVNRNSSWFMGPIPLKYLNIEGDGPGYPIDWVVFRYAEVLLSLAEAINEQRGPDDAYQYVNEVRRRASVSEWKEFSKEQLRDSLLDERGRELFSEGVRRQDLIRHGKFIQYAIDRGVNAEAHQVLFPIPFEVINEGKGIIIQNPGYEN